jgi:SAM-dependent methyltransferase
VLASGVREVKLLDITIADVTAAYEGAVGIIWEMLMGEQIHVGGGEETDLLARRAGVHAGTRVLDVLSGLGGPARHLARTYGATVTGLDATGRMVSEAVLRTPVSATASPSGSGTPSIYPLRRRPLMSSGGRTPGATSPTRTG